MSRRSTPLPVRQLRFAEETCRSLAPTTSPSSQFRQRQVGHFGALGIIQQLFGMGKNALVLTHQIGYGVLPCFGCGVEGADNFEQLFHGQI